MVRYVKLIVKKKIDFERRQNPSKLMIIKYQNDFKKS